MWKLSELTLVDFKSFSGTHVFSSLQDFHMSCVVGLNGSGKSNIVDALSFVLGGGSKAMRSERFAELCHRDRVSGQATGRRAQVIARFVDASSNTEIVFKRVVNSDSSTAFTVNSKIVERKAYIKALADISAYSKGCIVAQGYIESISLSSAQDKGQLLDRLSGSAALKDDYDAKKKRAGEINADLKIITAKKEDVEQTLRNMKKQYADLKRYLAVRARLRRAQSMLAVIQDKELTWQTTRAKARCDNIQKELEICKRKLKQKQDDIQENVAQQQSITTSIKEIKMMITRAQRAAVAKQEARYKLTESRDELKIQIELAGEALARAKKECTEIKKDYKTVMRDLSENLNQLETKKSVLKTSLDGHPYSKISESMKEKTASLAQKSGQEFRVQELMEEIQNATNRLASADAYLRTTEERKKTFSETVTATQRELEAANAELLGLERDIRENSSLLDKKAKMDKEIAQIQSTIKALTDQVYGSTDTSEKNSHVVTHLKRIRTVYGRVNDLLTVTDPRHITAIAIALGRQRNMIVVETYEDAIECIKILKSKRWGVEEFIPLEGRRGMDNTAVLKRLRQHSDLFRPAVDCITTIEERFMPAVTSILGDTVIIEGSLDRARDIAYRESKSFPALRIVTSDGQKIAKNGNITLGNSLDRKRPASGSAAMEGRIQDANVHLNRLMEDCARLGLNNCDVSFAQVEAARDQLSTKKNYVTRLKAKMDELELVVKTCVRESELALGTKTTAEQDVARLIADRTRVLNAQSSLNEDDKQLLTLYNEAAELNSGIEAVSTEETKAVRDAVNSLLSIMGRVGEDSYRLSGNDWKKELTVLSEKIEKQLGASVIICKAETNLQQLMTKRDNLEKEFESIAADDQEDLDLESRLRYEQGELENNLKSVKELSRQANTAVRDLLTEKHRYERDFYEQSEKMQEYSSKLVSLQESALALVPGADVEEINDAQIEPPALDDDRGDRYFRRQREKQEVDIADCNEEIKSMPLINHQADNMLEEIKAKLAVISDEFDTKKSAKNLVDLDIADLRETRRKLFLKCYNAVNKYLDEIYLTLTRVDAETFGSASLELEDEISAEPFAKGVIFHAIPPGKRYTDLESLSGGEKAMAALALLFACQRYNQAPFIVLDEVDAPLDLENLMALRDYIQTAPFQVFMITLKEEIYSAADSIIGVYKSPVDHNSHTITVSLLDFAKRESASCVENPIIPTAMTS